MASALSRVKPLRLHPDELTRHQQIVGVPEECSKLLGPGGCIERGRHEVELAGPGKVLPSASVAATASELYAESTSWRRVLLPGEELLG